MELDFLQKKYDKEVASRTKLQEILKEYEKTIHTLVGMSNFGYLRVSLVRGRENSNFADMNFLQLKCKMQKAPLNWKKNIKRVKKRERK